jgi:hypothetical protein
MLIIDVGGNVYQPDEFVTGVNMFLNKPSVQEMKSK